MGGAAWPLPSFEGVARPTSPLGGAVFAPRISGLADAVRAINSLASLIDVKGLGRPKEFSGREEDFLQWSQKTEGILGWCDQGVRDDVGVVS